MTTITTELAQRIDFGCPTESDSAWEIWLGPNLYRYRTDGKAWHVVEGMNHAHEQRVTSEPIKLALAAIVELQIQLNDKRAAKENQELRQRIAELEARPEQQPVAVSETNDQIAAVMMIHGSPEQKSQAMAYAHGLPTAQPVTVKLPKKNIGWDRDGDDCWNNAIDACRQALEEAGITIAEGE